MGNDETVNPAESTSRHCSRCGERLMAHVLAGHCSRCLMEVAFADHGSPESEVPASVEAGRRLGDYELLAELGRGGMGVVYRARQVTLQREVALKLLHGGDFAHPQSIRRFRQEAQAAARLRHPNIVAIHDVGEHDGILYYTMDLVEGPTLASVVASGPMPVRRAATYVETLARAVDHAHRHGILHRDLKPANILVDTDDRPRLVDFGLARPLDPESAQTLTGQAMGSPAYMAPEQALGRSEEVGPGCDIYALGAVLYHLITGRPPFQGETVNDLLLQVRGTDPVAPRRLNPAIPVDLDTLCLKCLEKAPSRRYASAEALAADLRRFLDHEPIRARPVGVWGRLVRWRRRRPMTAALTVGVFVLLLVVAIGSVVAGLRINAAREAEHHARESEERANAELRAVNRRLSEAVTRLELQRAESFFRDHDAATGLAHLASLARQDPADRVVAQRLVSALVHRNWAFPGPQSSHAGQVASVGFSPDGRYVLSASWDGTARISEATTLRRLITLRPGASLAFARYNRDGSRVVTLTREGSVGIWRSEDGGAVRTNLVPARGILSAELSPEGRWVATLASDGVLRFWSTEDGSLAREWLDLDGRAFRQVKFCGSDERVVTVVAGGSLDLFDWRTGEQRRRLPGRAGGTFRVEASPDGRRLAVLGEDWTVQLWDPLSGQGVGDLLRHGAEVVHVGFDGNGERLLTASADGFARIWNAASGFPASPPLAHEAAVRFGAFASHGPLAVTAGLDHTARVWDTRSGSAYCQPLRQAEQTVHAAFDLAGERLVTASYDGIVQVWDLTPRAAAPRELPQSADQNAIAFSPDGRRIVGGGDDAAVRWWQVPGGDPDGAPANHEGPVRGVEFSPNGRWVVSASDDRTARLWDADTHRAVGDPLRHGAGVAMASFSPDSARVVTASADGTARLWEVTNGVAVGAVMRHAAAVRVARFSPDGLWIVTASDDASARLWEARTGASVGQPIRHVDALTWVEFSPDSRLVVTASGDNTARLRRVPSGESAGPVLRHRRTVMRAVFSADSRRVVTVSLDRTARVWDVATGEAVSEPLRHESPSTRVCVGHGGEWIITGGWNGLLRLWDLKSGQPLSEWLDLGGSITTACADPSGPRFAAATARGVRLWSWPQLPRDIPAAIPELAEAVGGTRVTAQGHLELTPRSALDRLAASSSAASDLGYYERVTRWLLSDPTRRAPTPFE